MRELIAIVKGGLATTPVGAALVTWWDERECVALEKDLNSFMGWTVHHVNRLTEEDAAKLDRDFLDSEEFESLFDRLAEAYIASRSQKKRSAYQNILCKAIRKVRPTNLLRDQYLHVLDQTFETEIEILAVAHASQISLPAEGRSVLHEKSRPESAVVLVAKISTQLRISPEETLNIAWSLAGKGLIYPLGNALSAMSNVVVTPFGANFCQFISNDTCA